MDRMIPTYKEQEEWAGPDDEPVMRVFDDGTVMVTVEAAADWRDDFSLREYVRASGLASGRRMFAVVTPGGHVFDAWQLDHWQSGLDHA